MSIERDLKEKLISCSMAEAHLQKVVIDNCDCSEILEYISELENEITSYKGQLFPHAKRLATSNFGRKILVTIVDPDKYKNDVHVLNQETKEVEATFISLTVDTFSEVIYEDNRRKICKCAMNNCRFAEDL